MSENRQRGRARIRVEAPADLDPLVIAQAVVGSHLLLKAEPVGKRRKAPFNNRWLALSDLYQHAVGEYEKLAARMVDAIKDYVEAETDLIEKADRPPRPFLTPAQVKEIARIIRDHHTAFIASMAPDTVSEAKIQELIDRGVLPPGSMSLIKDSYLYGQFVSTIRAMEDRDELKKLTYQSFKKRVQRRPIPLTQHEKAAIEWAEHSAAVHVTGLGNRIADDFSTIAIEADRKLRKEYERTIRDTVKEGIERRKTWRKVASDLGHATGDWARDFGRIAATEMQRAHQEGFAQGLRKREGDDDVIMVAKIPNPDACKHCNRLHLTNGPGSAPRVFKLSELEENGSNVGRKAAEWKPVVGTVHPWCACELVHVPPGWGFEQEPPADEGWRKVPGSDQKGRAPRYKRTVKNPSRAYDAPEEIDQFWSPSLVPDSLRLSEWAFDRDLRKAEVMTYGDSVPERGVILRLGDPEMLAAAQEVVDETPEVIFDKMAGVTLITTDTKRVGSALDDHDLAYWTGNEIRLSQTLPAKKVRRVLRHEIGHALNVWLMHKLGGNAKVREWHDALDKISKREGYVSEYAKKLPIENAAEVSRLYIYDRERLMMDYPKQFTFVHKYYRPLFRGKGTSELSNGEFAERVREMSDVD